MERATVIGLLKKLGVTDATELSNERAQRRLKKRLEKMGPPENMTDAERALVDEIAGEHEAAPTNEETAPVEETTSTASQQPQTAKTAAKTSPTTGTGKASKTKAPEKKGEKASDVSPKSGRNEKFKKARVAFRELFGKSAEQDRADVGKLAMKFDVRPQVIWSYINEAKRDVRYHGFTLKETKGTDGVKTLKATFAKK